MLKRIRVVFLSEVPADYRTPLLEAIHEKLDLKVLYCSNEDPFRGPKSLVIAHISEVLPGVSAGGRKGGVRWKFNPSVWRKLTTLDPQVVIIGGYAHPTMQIAMFWCRKRRVPYVLHSETTDLSERSKWRRLVKAIPVRWAIAGAKAFLPSSLAASRYLERWGADRRCMFIFPNMPDVHRIARLVDQAGAAQGPPTFLFVGRLIAVKDLPTLIKAFVIVRRHIRDARLWIIGEGPLLRDLQRLCSEMDVRGVEFMGHVGEPDLYRFYAKADCFILPSRSETYGVVVLEAMAAGLPVIASNQVGSADDLITVGKNGFIFRVGDERELAQLMIKVFEEPIPDIKKSAREVALARDYAAGCRSMLNAVEAAYISLGPPV